MVKLCHENFIFWVSNEGKVQNLQSYKTGCIFLPASDLLFPYKYPLAKNTILGCSWLRIPPNSRASAKKSTQGLRPEGGASPAGGAGRASAGLRQRKQFIRGTGTQLSAPDLRLRHQTAH
ncbi:hypothetical protein EJB05_21573, partial [Eragrostis curvula]